MVAWPQSHVKHIFQTELGPAASSSLPYFALSETENKASLPWELPESEGRGPAQKRSLFCGHMLGLGMEVVFISCILSPFRHTRAMNHCGIAGTEPGLGE